jgi:hypothetical protein
MDDQQIDTIEGLSADEHDLWELQSAGNASRADRQLQELEVSLDQVWELLGLRRSLREAGWDPNATRLRYPVIVEGQER